MTPEDDRRIAEIFEQAVGLPPAERGAFVARACSDETTVRREVEALLALDAEVEAVGESPSWGLSPSAGAWLAQHLWEHFAFSRDTNYLQRVLPILSASAEFSLDWLVEDPQTKKLVAGPATSPENNFTTAHGQKASLCMAPAMEQQLVWDALNNYLEATRVLGVTEPTIAEAEKALPRLQGPKIGSDGRLMEWNEEFKENEAGHRHISHMFAWHPGRQITRTGTPELAAAARG